MIVAPIDAEAVELERRGCLRILINSDVMYLTAPMVLLPRWLINISEACLEHGHTIVLPQTALLEFNRRQKELVEMAERDLKSAYAVLDQYGLEHQSPEPSEIVTIADLPALLAATGVRVEVDVPTLADYEDAHRRASMHESPQSPDAKSDEMRDLIIWATALRHAESDGGAILLSRDTVHVHPRGDDEATGVGLIRLRTANDLLEYLGVQTPAGRQIGQMLAPAWEALRNAGLPIGGAPTLISVISPAFVQGTAGLASASCKIRVRVEESAIFSGAIHIEFQGNGIQKVTLSDGRIGAGQLLPTEVVEVPAVVQEPFEPYEIRLQDLLEVLEDDK